MITANGISDYNFAMQTKALIFFLHHPTNHSLQRLNINIDRDDRKRKHLVAETIQISGTDQH